MNTDNPVYIRFSGITLRLKPAAPVSFDEDILSLQCEASDVVDTEYEIRPLHIPLCPASSPVFDNNGTIIYRYDEGWLRIYPLLIAEDGCQVACLLCPDGKNVMYYPAAMWDYYTKPLRCVPYLALELLLLHRDAFLQHSSVVAYNGQAVLFSGPSSVGKSTQADLWHKYLGADIINGDRCVIMKNREGFYGGGSPLAGSSRIYRSEQSPIAGIILLEQSPENRIHQCFADALPGLLSQTLVNSWDTAFMDRLSHLYQELLESVPVYRLRCRPDLDSVKTAFRAVFRKEPPL